jgi:hypothetical protein
MLRKKLIQMMTKILAIEVFQVSYLPISFRPPLLCCLGVIQPNCLVWQMLDGSKIQMMTSILAIEMLQVAYSLISFELACRSRA